MLKKSRGLLYSSFISAFKHVVSLGATNSWRSRLSSAPWPQFVISLISECVYTVHPLLLFSEIRHVFMIQL